MPNKVNFYIFLRGLTSKNIPKYKGLTVEQNGIIFDSIFNKLQPKSIEKKTQLNFTMSTCWLF